MSSQIKRIGFVSIALGWFWDFLFWDRTPGISFAIYIALCILAGLFLLYSNKQKPSLKIMGLLIPIVVFSGFTFIRQEPFSLLLSIGCSLLLLQIMAMSLFQADWLSYGFVDYLIGIIRFWQSVIVHPITVSSEVTEPKNETRKQNSSRQIWQVVRGTALALPVVVIFSLLLCSADIVFAQKMSSFLDIFNLENMPELIIRIIVILAIAYALMGAYVHAVVKRSSGELYGNKHAIRPFLGFTEAAIVLGSVTILFTAFVIVQFQYFFGGQTNIHIDGYTYSEYARRGFGELLIVAIFTLILLLGLSHIVKREGSLKRKGFSWLGSIMVGLVGIILVSAFKRLLLYESAYGFTRLRTYTHVFMIWLGILLAITILLEITNHLQFFSNAALLIGLGFSLTINFLNVDGIIVQRNVQRSVQHEEIDTAYLASLSTDAVPMLVSLFTSPESDILTKDALGASLACMVQIHPSYKKPIQDWQSFQLSHWWAERALKSIEHQLSNYNLSQIGSQWQATSPEKYTYPCQSSVRID